MWRLQPLLHTGARPLRAAPSAPTPDEEDSLFIKRGSTGFDDDDDGLEHKELLKQRDIVDL